MDFVSADKLSLQFLRPKLLCTRNIESCMISMLIALDVRLVSLIHVNALDHMAFRFAFVFHSQNEI